MANEMERWGSMPDQEIHLCGSQVLAAPAPDKAAVHFHSSIFL